MKNRIFETLVCNPLLQDVNEDIELQYCATHEKTTYIFIKPLNLDKFVYPGDKLGVISSITIEVLD